MRLDYEVASNLVHHFNSLVCCAEYVRGQILTYPSESDFAVGDIHPYAQPCRRENLGRLHPMVKGHPVG